MKKVSLVISCDEEKAAALRLYLEQRNTTVEQELDKALEQLFQKVVPAGVRQYLGLRSGTAVEEMKPAKRAVKNEAKMAQSSEADFGPETAK